MRKNLIPLLSLLVSLTATQLASGRPPLVGGTTGGSTDTITRTGRGIGGIGHAGGACPAPSLSVCQAEMQSGGACAKVNDTACSQILRDAFAGAWTADQAIGAPSPGGVVCNPQGDLPCVPGAGGGLGLVQAILPGTMKSGGLLLDAALEPFQTMTITRAAIPSSDLTYANLVQTNQLPSAYRALDLPGLSPTIPAIPGDGTAVTHCAEYVYKKYWDYTRFEEAASSCRTDWLCVYDAFARTGADDVGLVKPTLRSNDRLHNPLALQFRPQPDGPPPTPITVKKNGFFRETVDPIVFGSAIAKLAPGTEGAELTTALHADYLADRAITDLVAWHVMMHDKQWAETAGAGMTLAEYAEHEKRMVNFGQLLAQYVALRDAAPGTVQAALDPSLFDACGHALTVDPTTGDILDTGCKKKGAYVPPASSTGAALKKVVDAIAAAYVAEWRHPSVHGTGIDHGCLDPASSRCDWSPKMLVGDFMHKLQAPREMDFQQCITETAENFTDSQYPTMAADLPAHADARTDWDAFKDWMDRADAARGEITKNLPWTGARDTIGTSKAGTKVLGDKDWFAASYDYEASWSLHLDKVKDPAFPDLNVRRICRAQGTATAKLKADVWAVKQPLPIIDAYVHMHAGQGGDSKGYVAAHLYLLDSPIYTVPGESIGWDFTPDPLADKIEHSDTVFVGFVPVTLGARVEFSAGFEAHASASAPEPADSACNFDDPTGVQLAATVTPYARASAAAWGALGGEFAGFGAEAGVEGHVTLVDASLPTTATIAFGGRTAFDSDTPVPSVHVKMQTRLDLELLSGGVVAYAEVCYFVGCKRTEKPIFTWGGFRVHEPIWTPIDSDYPIQALNAATPPKPVTTP